MITLEVVEQHIAEFSKTTHGSTDLGREVLYVKGVGEFDYLPLKMLSKKFPQLEIIRNLQEHDFIYAPYNFVEESKFLEWYERQFGKKLPHKMMSVIQVLYHPNQTKILQSLESVNKEYEVFRDENILINSKNLPVQVGEWYAKYVFGLTQVKSTSQRGFDFELDGNKVEVKVHWADKSSPKGVKIRKSLVGLSDFCIVIYVARNFMIRDICILDSDFITRKFTGKGHTVFLKDSEVSTYFFSKSSKHFDKIRNKNALMKFASPALAMKLEGRI